MLDQPPGQAGTMTLLVATALILRAAIALYPHSGQHAPPPHGDYEAQRHWMEITLHTPLSAWYVNSSLNPLEYWGLDYPPLSAYHSLTNGLIASLVDPSFVRLQQSRGLDSAPLRLFMRGTVLLADLLVYMSACCLLVLRLRSCTAAVDSGWRLLVCLLFCPALPLIDHGHFQYNCCSLGLFLLALVFLLADSTVSTSRQRCLCSKLAACVCFVLSLNYKQMQLYHALPIFCYLLGWCLHGTRRLWRFSLVAMVTLATFLIVWLPFIWHGQPAVYSVLARLFPVARGLYEDKVANFWCFLSVFVRPQDHFSVFHTLAICASLTFLCSVPSNVRLLMAGASCRDLVYSLVLTALAFFMLSYHVHEKSILLAVVPLCLLHAHVPHVSVWATLVCTLSMSPLLVRDRLLYPTVISCLVFCLVMVLAWQLDCCCAARLKTGARVSVWFQLVVVCSLFSYLLLMLCLQFVTPPIKYPYLWSALISFYSFIHLFLFYVYLSFAHYFPSLEKVGLIQ